MTDSRVLSPTYSLFAANGCDSVRPCVNGKSACGNVIRRAMIFVCVSAHPFMSSTMIVPPLTTPSSHSDRSSSSSSSGMSFSCPGGEYKSCCFSGSTLKSWHAIILTLFSGSPPGNLREHCGSDAASAAVARSVISSSSFAMTPRALPSPCPAVTCVPCFSSSSRHRGCAFCSAAHTSPSGTVSATPSGPSVNAPAGSPSSGYSCATCRR
mmetsp:Transcript_5598/g.14276  ORF Transcript_5598/g.14276 Transcript_5598/m.14276 type:complete len:210 (-) Transcript_5598:823-1452(-)